jgi:hypothetical protein
MLNIFINMKGMLNPPLEVGDKVICYHMENETAVPPGTVGTVTKIQRDPFEDEGDIISVDWENGSTLALVSVTDAWKKLKEKTIEEQTGSKEYDFYQKNSDIFNNFDWKFFRKYMDKVRETGVVNVFAAAPLLYSGKQHIDRYYGENPSNPDEFEELLDMADEARDKMAQGVISWMESNGKEVELNSVNRNLPRLAQKLIQLWMNFY